MNDRVLGPSCLVLLAGLFSVGAVRALDLRSADSRIPYRSLSMIHATSRDFFGDVGRSRSPERERKLESAHQAFSRALSRFPDDPWGWSQRGLLEGLLGRPIDSIVWCYTRALVQEPTNPHHHYFLAFWHLRGGRESAADAHAHAARIFGKAHPGINVNLGQYHLIRYGATRDRSHLEQALRCLSTSIRVMPVEFTRRVRDVLLPWFPGRGDLTLRLPPALHSVVDELAGAGVW